MPTLSTLKAHVAEIPRRITVIKDLIRLYDAGDFREAAGKVMYIFDWAESPQGTTYWRKRHTGEEAITPADIVWLNQLVPDYERIRKVDFFRWYDLPRIRSALARSNVDFFSFDDASYGWGIPREEFPTTIGRSSLRVVRHAWELLNIHERQTPRTKVTPIPEDILAVPLVQRAAAAADPNDRGASHPNYRPGAKPEYVNFGNACCVSTVYSWGGSASEGNRKFVIGDAEMRQYHTFLDAQRKYSTMLLQWSQFKQYEHLIADLGWSRTTKWMDGNSGETVAFFVRCNRDTTQKAAINGQHNCTDSDDT
jgi:hypothetical protein